MFLAFETGLRRLRAQSCQEEGARRAFAGLFLPDSKRSGT